MVIIPLFTALLISGTFIRFPFGAMPITLQTMVIFLIGLLLTPKEAVLSVSLYLFLGLIGLPVFTTGGGIPALLAPSGGFLFSMVPAVFVGSILKKIRTGGILLNFVYTLVMYIVMYAGGLLFMKYKLNISWSKTFTIGLVPYLPGEVIKISAACLASKTISPLMIKFRERNKELIESKE